MRIHSPSFRPVPSHTPTPPAPPPIQGAITNTSVPLRAKVLLLVVACMLLVCGLLQLYLHPSLRFPGGQVGVLPVLAAHRDDEQWADVYGVSVGSINGSMFIFDPKYLKRNNPTRVCYSCPPLGRGPFGGARHTTGLREPARATWRRSASGRERRGRGRKVGGGTRGRACEDEGGEARAREKEGRGTEG